MVRKDVEPAAQRPSILIVCEGGSSLERAAEQLSEQGYRVRHATSTYKAVLEQSKAPCEVVVLDTTPLLERDMEVFEVFRSLAPRPFLLASFPASARDKARLALQRGADAYVLEPFDPQEITLLLARNVERRAAPERGEPLAERLTAMARFAAGVAHEINNPLTTISGWIQLALADMGDEDPGRRVFTTMQEEVDRIAGIVRNLLCFAGQAPLDEEPVAVNEVLDEILAAIDEEELSITTELDGELPLILASRDQIRQAFQQVINNALKSLGGRGELHVATRALDADDQVIVEISDDGCGIPEGVMDRIFDPFYSNGNGGTGLGLSAAYGIVQGHGGTIEVTSREREGTCFVIRLPLHRLRTRNRILEYAK
ncbi:MAG: ATP-binding protein [Candidatus Brocadiia bacterium]